MCVGGWKTTTMGERAGERTVLADGGAAAEDERRLACVLGLAALLPGWGKPNGPGPFLMRPDTDHRCSETERYGCGLVEGDIVGKLNARSNG